MQSQKAVQTDQQLLEAVARVRPIAEAHARDADRASKLHGAVIDAMRAEGLFGFAAPREVGGVGASALTQLAVFEAMARAEPAAGWSLMIGAISTAMMGAYLPEGAVERIFKGRMPITAGHQAPLGRARRVGGGFEVSGRWAFGSGIRHADWVITVAAVDGSASAGGPPAFIQLAVPIERVTVEDTWDSSFLRGSGSEHYRLEGEFVEEAFTCPFPTAPRLRGGSDFDLPFMALVTPAHVGFALGVAQRALDEIAAVAPQRIITWTHAPLGDHGGFRKDLGRAHTKLAAARALAVDVVGRMSARVASGGELDVREWSEIRALTAHATDVAAEVATFAFRSGGGSALYAGGMLERCFRDIHGATQHVAASDDSYEFAGRVLLGDGQPNPILVSRARVAR
ncbi:acyl-CoA dehydrogenase family protein [Polyangium aurulentum]|uniref:acyl-CoA dehydrogenase family protein n=1 Tax=Polyangium aurulentum TaxID=2567896 RepID=UPI0010AE77D8|nr:acyl-CoA dehydrogenase family protein [Polyangium aurulentum]UQA61332.1 acyl-CoA dehydrogenase family protein [Polyangium aurulentum]